MSQKIFKEEYKYSQAEASAIVVLTRVFVG